MSKHCRSSSDTVFQLVIIIILIILSLGLPLFHGIIKVINPQTYNVTVQSKEIKNSGNSGRFLVFCTDPTTGESRVFEVTDSLFKGRFDSADVYNLIEEDQTYKFTTGGYRIPLLSMYPNIYEVDKIDVPILENVSD